MSDDDPRTEILRLEAKIEELRELIERCRKIILISKIAVAIGGIWLLALAIVMRLDPVSMIGAIAVIIGGASFLGRIRVQPSKLRLPLKLPKHSEPN